MLVPCIVIMARYIEQGYPLIAVNNVSLVLGNLNKPTGSS